MFESLKKLWNKDPLLTEKPIVVKTNISEPVISFVNAVKKNPKRFIIKKGAYFEDGVHFYGSDWIKYSVTDCVVEKIFTSVVVKDTSAFGHKSPDRIYGKSEPWLTDEEVLYVVKELEDFFKEKVERVKSKIEKRARERLTKLYKGE